ncbi:MAG: signal peptidase II [Pseudomonadota bacterium]|nr:signal peptidase II [Pseudomonadota bacterium]MDE3036858.1 signal peptidase II [Pseudomonadota bacterium]
MPIANSHLFPLSLLLAADVLLIDRISKWLILTHVARHEAIRIAPFFNITLVLNSGISFGMFADHYAPLVWASLSAVIVGILLVWLYRSRLRLVAVGLGLVIGGALGNVVDRLRFSAVVDFLDFHLGAWHWPAFNVADSAICVGVAVLCVSGMLESSQRPTESSRP